MASKYRLERPFYDGMRYYERGDVIEAEEGLVPSSAVPVEDEAPVKKAAKEEPTALSELPSEALDENAATLSQMSLPLAKKGK